MKHIGLALLAMAAATLASYAEDQQNGGLQISGTPRVTFAGRTTIANAFTLWHDEPFFATPTHVVTDATYDRIREWRTDTDVIEDSPDDASLIQGSRELRVRTVDVAPSTINPPDNAMAMNAAGFIVCAINSRVFIADTSAVVLAARSLDAFLQPAINGPIRSRFFCDPRVLFDATSQRFIVSAMT